MFERYCVSKKGGGGAGERKNKERARARASSTSTRTPRAHTHATRSHTTCLQTREAFQRGLPPGVRARHSRASRQRYTDISYRHRHISGRRRLCRRAGGLGQVSFLCAPVCGGRYGSGCRGLRVDVHLYGGGRRRGWLLVVGEGGVACVAVLQLRCQLLACHVLVLRALRVCVCVCVCVCLVFARSAREGGGQGGRERGREGERERMPRIMRM